MATTVPAPESTDRVEILCLEGYETIPELRREIAHDLDALIAEAPAEVAGDALACSCLRPEGDHWVGILRLRTHAGHAYASARGDDASAVASALRDRVASYRRSFPELTPAAEAFPECHTQCCHLGRRSLFYVERDPWRRGAKKARKQRA